MKNQRKIICFICFMSILCTIGSTKGYAANQKNTSLAVIKKSEVTSQTDMTLPSVNLTYSVMNQKATVKVEIKTETADIKKILYIKGSLMDTTSEKWKSIGKEVDQDTNEFTVTTAGNYSVLVEDNDGNKTISVIKVTLEMRAVWISYLEFDTYRKNNAKNLNETSFSSYFNKVFDKCAELNLNTVIVQVRPFSDAIYPSDYFPWSYSITGTQGKDPGFDPLRILIDAAHERGLEFHAWINPYRVTGDSKTNNIAAMSKDNQAKKWYNSSNASSKRNVLNKDGKLYFNPAKSSVQNFIVNGVKEIVENYDVDGIHLDDYFYPGLGSNYTKTFDAQEYNSYVKFCKTTGVKQIDIVTWRRNNVNALVRKLYQTVKDIDKNVQFGISPQGNINNLYAKSANYADVKTWMNSSDYIDYICPQIYWSFEYNPNTYAFDIILEEWLEARKSSDVKIYIGIAAYKAGSSATSSAVRNASGKIIDKGWLKSKNQIAKQIEYSRSTKQVDGYALFRYDFLLQKKLENEVKTFVPLFK